MAFSYFEDFLINSTSKSTIFELITSFSVVGEILFGIFSQSNTLSFYLINNPQRIFWLMENSTLAYSKTKKEFYDEIAKRVNRTDNFEKREYYIREYRKNEYLRIATREIINACDFTEIMKELSHLASALIEISLLCAKDKLKKRYGGIGDFFSVIGMGKLGNMELNFSSDIDLLFVHKDEGKNEYYNRLASGLISILNDNKEGGFVYRVDMRLRPGGKASALSLTAGEYEDYYSTFGQMWERMSLTKAYPVAGDINLGREFLKTIEPFVYRKSFDLEYIKSIRSLMFKIKKYSKKSLNSEFIPVDKVDIKKGSGGIREIEFIVNYFQLIYGGKDKTLRHVNTIEGLNMIEERGYFDKNSVDMLKESYIFFRKIEHKIQLLNEQQTQDLPVDKAGLEKLAKKLKMTFYNFVSYYVQATDKVHDVFNRIFIRDDKIPIFGTIDDIEAFLIEYNIKNIHHVSNIIKDVVKKFLAEDIKRAVIEEIFDYSFGFVKKDMFESCVNGLSAINPVYTALMFKNKRLFNTFLKMLSVNLGSKLAKHSELFEYFIFSYNVEFNSFNKEEYEKALLLNVFGLFLNPYEYNLDILNDFTVNFIRSIAKKYDKEEKLCIIGYGKVATGELFIRSDLDLVFIAEKNAYLYTDTVQKIVKELKSLYDVDLRLRPYGERGSIVVDVEYLGKYFKQSAWAWEKQAAQKSKIVYSGFSKDRIENMYHDFVTLNPPNKSEILDMKNKIELYKGKSYDIKNFRGGINDIEFLVQSICFDNSCIEIGKSCLDLLDIIEQNKIFGDISVIKKAYIFYTMVLNVYRVFAKGSTIDKFEVLEFLLEEEDIKNQIEDYRAKVTHIFNGWFK